MRVAVVGGGVIGMLQARSLASEACHVSIIDQGELGRESSWAGGGIISPLYPWRYDEAVTALARRSQSLYPQLVADLHNESGIDPEYVEHGLLMLSVKDEKSAVAWSKDHSAWMEEIDSEALYNLEPSLAEGHIRSLWMPKVGSVRNPRLLNALRHIMHQHSNITVIENKAVAQIVDRRLVLASGESLDFDAVVVCAGAWTSKLLASPSINIEPVKGQMIVFDAPKNLVNRVVLSDGRYVIPRKDGKVVAGSTLEYTGFDKQTDEQAKQSLYESATALFPALSECQVIHHWAGLRPGSSQGIPSIGALPERDNIFVNAGHFRNGLVLAPASVELMSDLIAKRPTKVDLKAYAPR